ncbi:MAG: DegT/DnrJ/EryC1/StrS family aminotransferase [Bacteroidota bacterium]
MKVPYNNLAIQHKNIKAELLEVISEIIDTGQFILGEEVKKFEKSFAALCGTEYAISVANGTDALFLTMKGLGIGPGDEVITAPNSFLASASSIAIAGATPVFADVRDDFNLDPVQVKKAITPNTRAIIAVHLTGRPAPLNELADIAKQFNIHLIEDAAQAVGAEYNGKKVGSFGIAGCFSLHPLKNLSACGDGGVITTNNAELYNYLLKARNHGLINRDECAFWSYNSRLDNIQAAILNVKIGALEQWTQRRREIAGMYQKQLKTIENSIIPVDSANEKAVYHTFIIQVPQRDALQKYLAEQGVDSKIHYPIAIHLQEGASYLGYKKGDFPVAEKQMETILSLPMFPELTNEQIAFVTQSVLDFFKKN